MKAGHDNHDLGQASARKLTRDLLEPRHTTRDIDAACRVDRAHFESIDFRPRHQEPRVYDAHPRENNRGPANRVKRYSSAGAGGHHHAAD